MKRNAIILNEQDNVATMLSEVEEGGKVIMGLGDKIIQIEANDLLQFGHKIATQNIAEGEKIIKYGAVIGIATGPIRSGDHAHVHNIDSLRGRGDLEAGAGENA